MSERESVPCDAASLCCGVRCREVEGHAGLHHYCSRCAGWWPTEAGLRYFERRGKTPA